jgi:hypothetical protein
MSVLNPVNGSEGELLFWCPGCDGAHAVKHGAGPGPRWSWNGSLDKPTFSPSILVQGMDLTEKGRADLDAWREAGCPRRVEPFETVPTVCHSFVTDGRIQFLSDCTHELAGQTVDLPDLEAS